MKADNIIKKGKTKVKRRRFVSTLAFSGVAIPFLNVAGYDLSVPQSKSDRHIHIFSKPLQWLSWEGAAELIAESGAEGIDIPVRLGGHVLPEKVKTDLPLAVAAARKNGLKVEMIVTDITRADEQYTEDILQTASELGIKYYRFGYLNYDNKISIWDTLQNYKPRLKKLETINRKYNIHGAYQNHYGTRVGGPVWDLFELLRELDPQYIGCQYDVRHAVAEASASWVNSLKLIAPWVKCTDIKDFKWSVAANGKWSPESVPIGKGTVDFNEYFKIVKNFNIGGPISIHFEYPPFERFNEKLADAEKRKLFVTEMKKDVDTLKSFLLKFQL